MDEFNHNEVLVPTITNHIHLVRKIDNTLYRVQFNNDHVINIVIPTHTQQNIQGKLL